MKILPLSPAGWASSILSPCFLCEKLPPAESKLYSTGALLGEEQAILHLLPALPFPHWSSSSILYMTVFPFLSLFLLVDKARLFEPLNAEPRFPAILHVIQLHFTAKLSESMSCLCNPVWSLSLEHHTWRAECAVCFPFTHRVAFEMHSRGVDQRLIPF